MAQRDYRYTLKGMIEAEVGYFTVKTSKVEQNAQKAGRGSKTKSNAMIMAELTLLENIETGTVDRQCGYFNAKVLKDHRADGTDDMLKKTIDPEKAIVFSAKSTSYIYIADYAAIPMTEKSSEKDDKGNTQMGAYCH